MTGLAQKGGAVVSARRASRRRPRSMHAVRIAAGGADLRARLRPGRRAPAPRRWPRCSSGVDARAWSTPHWSADRRVHRATRTCAFPPRPMRTRRSARPSAPATPSSSMPPRIATALMGDSDRHQPVHARLRLPEGPGAAVGRGDRAAIELNGVAVEANKRAFHWGRRAAVDRARRERPPPPKAAPASHAALSQTLDEIVERRARVPDRLPGRRLRRALPRRWSTRVREAESGAAPGRPRSPRRSRATTSS